MHDVFWIKPALDQNIMKCICSLDPFVCNVSHTQCQECLNLP